MIKIDDVQQKKLDKFMQVQMKEYKIDSLNTGLSKLLFILATLFGFFFFMVETKMGGTMLCLFAGAFNLMNLGFMIPPYHLPSGAGNYGTKIFTWSSMEYFPVSRGQMAYFCIRAKWKVCVKCALIAICGQAALAILIHKGNLLAGMLIALVVYVMLPLCVDGGYILFAKEK